MAYQLLVDLPLNRSRSSQLSCLGSGIPSLVGGFGSRVIEETQTLDLFSMGGGFFRIKSVLGKPGKTDWIERRCLCLFFIDRIPIICSLRRRRQGRGTEHVLSSTSIRH